MLPRLEMAIRPAFPYPNPAVKAVLYPLQSIMATPLLPMPAPAKALQLIPAPVKVLPQIPVPVRLPLQMPGAVEPTLRLLQAEAAVQPAELPLPQPPQA